MLQKFYLEGNGLTRMDKKVSDILFTFIEVKNEQRGKAYLIVVIKNPVYDTIKITNNIISIN